MRGTGRFPVFFVLFVCSILIFVFAKIGWMDGAVGAAQSVFLPIQRTTAGFFGREDTREIGRLKDENSVLRAELAKMRGVEKDNAALRDQFEQSYPKPETLMPAKVVGSPAFLPGVSEIEEIIIDRGSRDGVKVGEVIVYRDNLVGKVIKVSPHLSVVNVISRTGISFAAETTDTSALGVLSGKGEGKMILENVVLSDKLKKGDTVITKGDGGGIPSRLVVGRIVSINKKASSLFQSAEVESLIDFSRLEQVFVM